MTPLTDHQHAAHVYPLHAYSELTNAHDRLSSNPSSDVKSVRKAMELFSSLTDGSTKGLSYAQAAILYDPTGKAMDRLYSGSINSPADLNNDPEFNQGLVEGKKALLLNHNYFDDARGIETGREDLGLSPQAMAWTVRANMGMYHEPATVFDRYINKSLLSTSDVYGGLDSTDPSAVDNMRQDFVKDSKEMFSPEHLKSPEVVNQGEKIDNMLAGHGPVSNNAYTGMTPDDFYTLVGSGNTHNFDSFSDSRLVSNINKFATSGINPDSTMTFAAASSVASPADNKDLVASWSDPDFDSKGLIAKLSGEGANQPLNDVTQKGYASFVSHEVSLLSGNFESSMKNQSENAYYTELKDSISKDPEAFLAAKFRDIDSVITDPALKGSLKTSTVDSMKSFKSDMTVEGIQAKADKLPSTPDLSPQSHGYQSSPSDLFIDEKVNNNPFFTVPKVDNNLDLSGLDTNIDLSAFGVENNAINPSTPQQAPTASSPTSTSVPSLSSSNPLSELSGKIEQLGDQINSAIKGVGSALNLPGSRGPRQSQNENLHDALKQDETSKTQSQTQPPTLKAQQDFLKSAPTPAPEVPRIDTSFSM